MPYKVGDKFYSYRSGRTYELIEIQEEEIKGVKRYHRLFSYSGPDEEGSAEEWGFSTKDIPTHFQKLD